MRFGKIALLALALCALMTVAASAASLDGSWIVKTPGRDGATTDVTYTFKTDGGKITGTIAGGRGGDRPIKDGKVEGDSFEFSVERPGRNGGDATVVTYKGRVTGDTISFSTMMGDRSVDLKGERKK
jgi:hypothetical protein